MKKLHEILKEERVKNKLLVREVANKLNIDQALVSKFESAVRKPTRAQVVQLAKIYNIEEKPLVVAWLSEKIMQHLQYEEFASDALSMVAEESAEYEVSKKPIIPSSDIQNLINDLEKYQNELKEFRHLDSYKIAEALELEYTFESNRIEGNTLTLKETDLVINEGLTISGKSMREHLEAINHTDAIAFIKDLTNKKTIITESIILQIHNLVLRGIDVVNAGRYRTVQVMIKGSKHLPPQPFMVAKQMEDYFLWYKRNKSKLHPVVLAAYMHEKLVTIHPFIDGNGRTSRLVMNLILLQHGYVIANIKGDVQSRMKYYEVLEKVQINESQDAFVKFICMEEIDAIKKYIHILSR